MIDYGELRAHGPRGEGLEQLTRLLLDRLGMITEWSGRGADQGRDLLATESLMSPIKGRSTRWLVSCKDKHESGSAVKEDDLPSIYDKKQQHKANGFLLVTTTTAGAAAKAKLDGQNQDLVRTAVWDRAELDRLLLMPEHRPLLKQFFPTSYAEIVRLDPIDSSLPNLASLPEDVVRRVTELLAPYAKSIRFGRSIWPDEPQRADAFDQLCSSLLDDPDDVRALAESANPEYVDVIKRVLTLLEDISEQVLAFEFASDLMKVYPLSDCSLNCFQFLKDADYDGEGLLALTQFLDEEALAHFYEEDATAYVESTLLEDCSNYSLYSTLDELSSSTAIDEVHVESIGFSSDGTEVAFSGTGSVTCELSFDREIMGSVSVEITFEGAFDGESFYLTAAEGDTSGLFEDDSDR